ncbi:hypothetical protein HRM2_48030 [Desulforapulum autotrophicum HRM2]|uniref:Uncharacterized protein n=1 Tax=Desulforapulum autotrophicum (strain ATCC 43914 / DSM 3382 / VKM B-1955 / HRM2) TaxID=177437 RepID=C0QHJ3_DESAH|nr:hypothetical protein HRM2_48030 [Desulforapulum autotrophicum HRM2]
MGYHARKITGGTNVPPTATTCNDEEKGGNTGNKSNPVHHPIARKFFLSPDHFFGIQGLGVPQLRLKNCRQQRNAHIKVGIQVRALWLQGFIIHIGATLAGKRLIIDRGLVQAFRIFFTPNLTHRALQG